MEANVPAAQIADKRYQLMKGGFREKIPLFNVIADYDVEIYTNLEKGNFFPKIFG